MEMEFYRNLPKKECCECGCEIKEQFESFIYLCERCMNSVNE